MIQAWRREKNYSNSGILKKRDHKTVPDLAEFTAFGSKLHNAIMADGKYSEETAEKVKGDVISQCP